MEIVRSIAGRGTLVIDAQRVDGVSYRIDISRLGRNRLDVSGKLQAQARNTSELVKAFMNGQAALELEGGGSVNIVPTQMSIVGGPPAFSFAASGPIPGFDE